MNKFIKIKEMILICSNSTIFLNLINKKNSNFKNIHLLKLSCTTSSELHKTGDLE